uniref:Photosynthetic NDH subcomplex L 2 n=1 Tax=Hypseocharis bilobata TaxID=253189 RepID=A0A0F7GX29_9ROSI
MSSTSFTNTTALLHPHATTTPHNHHRSRSLPVPRASIPSNVSSTRRKLVTTFLATSLGLVGAHATTPLASLAEKEKWGTRSFLKEHFFEPGLSPEDAVARIRNTAEGLHSLREMVDTMSWRYVIFYIRLKQSYLNQDLKNAMSTLPEGRRQDYVNMANELIDNMAEFDYYVRTPKVYESYLYYEKTLKSIDGIVGLLA